MDVDIHAASRSIVMSFAVPPFAAAPTATVQPWAIVIPGPVAIVATTVNFCDATAQTKLQAEQNKGAEEDFF
jgi:hypothetical protein